MTDPEQEHPTWTHGWSGTRRVSLITRAELHQAHPDEWPEIPDIAAVVATEVSRVWRRELRAPRTWLRTEYVDLSLTSLARAHLTQRTGHLTSKDEAIAALEDLGVPDRLASAVRARRWGQQAAPQNRLTRAVKARRTVKQLLSSL